ncbi:hypothetical protein SAMN04488516_101437 [Desulfonauticus submarinus]|uniref:Uncharacterized protein n=1 Tax=Desulfonauticus submarinus TaxID=206665 RepID=A0A1H0AJK5_9BACT|nr:hypothetical protein SAMN04488516_101437 [Desulfonauticus submarinus]
MAYLKKILEFFILLIGLGCIFYEILNISTCLALKSILWF